MAEQGPARTGIIAPALTGAAGVEPIEKRQIGGRSALRPMMWTALYGLLLALYVLLRYQATWLEGDTARMIGLARLIADTGSLTGHYTYNYGFNYPSLAVFLGQVAGLAIADLLTTVRPFMVAIVVPLAFILFRQLLRSAALAAFAALLLLLQPEFLFVTLRGSHEVVTWSLMLLAMFFLSRGASVISSPRAFIVHVGLFYLVAFGQMSTNVFFASTFIFALLISFIGERVLGVWQKVRHRTSVRYGRLAYVTVACFVLVFGYMFYVYPPAQQALLELTSIGDRVSALLLNFSPEVDPYRGVISTLWISTTAYLALSLANWFVLFTSLMVWSLFAWRMLAKGHQLDRSLLLLWLFYGAFALQMAVSIVIDLSGALSGNLQLRVFPGFMIAAVPLSALGLLMTWKALRQRWPRVGWAYIVGLTCLVAWFSGAALLKATTEPIVSNKWTFSSASEDSALSWTGSRLRGTSIWLGQDERLQDVSQLVLFGATNDLVVRRYSLDENLARYALLSDVMRMWSARARAPLPDVQEAHRIYDNGSVTLYHFRPRTPFEK